MHCSRIALAISLGLIPATFQAQAPKLSGDHDGIWSVTLTCDDFRSDKGLAKGYTMKFVISIAAGRVEGEHKVPGTGAQLRYVGQVHEGGELMIQALGATGAPEYTPNRVQPGTAYGYTLRGQLEKNTGMARRVELRPCTAAFNRQP